MKKLVLITILFVSIQCYSQITLDFQLPITSLMHFRLSASETKYVTYDFFAIAATNQFSVYNSDGSLYKTIHMPAKPDTSAEINEFNYISTDLFDMDPSTIEYLVCYKWDSLQTGYNDHYKVEVIREDGTILLNEPNALPLRFWNTSVYNTESGPKLYLYYQFANNILYQTKVFTLPGELPASSKTNFDQQNPFLSVYPNPNDGNFFIKWSSSQNDFPVIDLYSINGKLVDSFTLHSTIQKSSYPFLKNGIYILNAYSDKTTSNFKFIIKK